MALVDRGSTHGAPFTRLLTHIRRNFIVIHRRILDRIDAMRKVPEQVRKYMKSKHFVTAAWLIVDTLRSLEVGACQRD